MNPAPQHKDTTLEDLLDFYYMTLDGKDYTPCWYEIDSEKWEKQKQALLSWRDKAVVEARLDEAKMHDFVNIDERIAYLSAQLKETPDED